MTALSTHASMNVNDRFRAQVFEFFRSNKSWSEFHFGEMDAVNFNDMVGDFNDDSILIGREEPNALAASETFLHKGDVLAYCIAGLISNSSVSGYGVPLSLSSKHKVVELIAHEHGDFVKMRKNIIKSREPVVDYAFSSPSIASITEYINNH